ncbi:hypothetical protein I302_101064 [Kwoniella bestiolae CBS 10118]|uniref:Uncharacterized protein n=1 Tax=Kwoniella bestiolae CBS 10118 TaxID=1296100 RepID=A0A1B9G6W4_9TREE|nr:hypothetical protein I302_04440 [Kwoniella bestiolae CBS 10118]OCF26752.1 hypothetical protein I302_04440 [Kwoniella bestiolae CBS 10118]
MTQDTKPLIPSLSPEDDLDLPPPSYDHALASSSSSSPPDVGSSTAQPVEERTIPQHLLHLFSGPPNAEPPIGRDYVPPQQIQRIAWNQKGEDIESWDPKLSDPNAMYDFIRAQAMVPPTVKIRCRGQHMETLERDQTVIENGIETSKKRGDTYYVTDFNFTINLSDLIDHPSNNNHIHLRTIQSDRAVYRGTHTSRYGASYAPDHAHNPHAQGGYQSLDAEMEYGVTDVGRKPSGAELADHIAWDDCRGKKGIPGWVRMQSVPEFWETRVRSKLPTVAASQEDLEIARAGMDDRPSLKEWCKSYCRDHGIFKEFWVHKGVYGWELENVQTAIKTAILSTGYQSNCLTITTHVTPLAIVIRPDNVFSRAINHGFIYFLSWITLIWPLIWILKRAFPRFLGAPWNVTYVNYALKCYPPLPSTFPNESISQAQDRLPGLYKLHPELPENPTLQYGPKGVHYLLGRKEGEWFREWEERIRMGVRMRFQGELQGGSEGERDAGAGLDGY